MNVHAALAHMSSPQRCAPALLLQPLRVRSEQGCVHVVHLTQRKRLNEKTLCLLHSADDNASLPAVSCHPIERNGHLQILCAPAPPVGGGGGGGWRHVPDTMVRRPRLSRAAVFLSPSTLPQADLWEQDLCPRTIQNWMKPFWVAFAR